MHHIVAISGMPGSGKSTAIKIAKDLGYSCIRFGQLTIDTVRERGMVVTPENEQIVREDLRQKHGMAAYATLNLPTIEQMLEQGDVVIDGLYSWSEYKVLKEKYGDRLTMLAIHVPPKIRYRRLSERKTDENDTALNNRTISKEDAMKRDVAEIENIEKGGPIAMADHMIVNTKGYDDFVAELNQFYQSLA